MISQFSGAVFDQHRAYRFLLWRFWDERPRMLFVGLNPSTANELENDPTIRRLCGFARDWGYGGLYACNLFSFITPHPEELAVSKYLHPANYPAIQMAGDLSALTLAGWGDGINKLPGSPDIVGYIRANYLKDPMCFGLTQNGNPKHPLYLSIDAQLVDYHVRLNEWRRGKNNH